MADATEHHGEQFEPVAHPLEALWFPADHGDRGTGKGGRAKEGAQPRSRPIGVGVDLERRRRRRAMNAAGRARQRRSWRRRTKWRHRPARGRHILLAEEAPPALLVALRQRQPDRHLCCTARNLCAQARPDSQRRGSPRQHHLRRPRGVGRTERVHASFAVRPVNHLHLRCRTRSHRTAGLNRLDCARPKLLRHADAVPESSTTSATNGPEQADVRGGSKLIELSRGDGRWGWPNIGRHSHSFLRAVSSNAPASAARARRGGEVRRGGKVSQRESSAVAAFAYSGRRHRLGAAIPSPARHPGSSYEVMNSIVALAPTRRPRTRRAARANSSRRRGRR